MLHRWHGNIGDAADVCRSGVVERSFVPDAAEAALLAPRLERFRALYPALRGHFSRGLDHA